MTPDEWYKHYEQVVGKLLEEIRDLRSKVNAWKFLAIVLMVILGVILLASNLHHKGHVGYESYEDSMSLW